MRAKAVVRQYNDTANTGTGLGIGQLGIAVMWSPLGTERDVMTLELQSGHLARGEQVVKPARSLLVGPFF